MSNELSQLKPVPGSTRPRKRVGRGEGSGKGRTAGRGQKGSGARSGYGIKVGFEGGQMPLQRRLPKRGFHNPFSKDYSTLNVSRLAHLEAGTVVTGELLKQLGVISKLGQDGLKILGGGDLQVALTIQAARFTKSAVQKIEAAGGTAEVV